MGKGALTDRLVGDDPKLWLSRSWTTRPPRPGESPDAYNFVSRPEFEARIADGGFLEWAEFMAHLYGTPVPEVPPDRDLVLEIEVQGASQILKLHPDAVMVFLVAPSPQEQAERLRKRGESEQEVQRRLERGAEEEAVGRTLTSNIVVNDDLSRAAAEVRTIVERHRGGTDRVRARDPLPKEPDG